MTVPIISSLDSRGQQLPVTGQILLDTIASTECITRGNHQPFWVRQTSHTVVLGCGRCVTDVAITKKHWEYIRLAPPEDRLALLTGTQQIKVPSDGILYGLERSLFFVNYSPYHNLNICRLEDEAEILCIEASKRQASKEWKAACDHYSSSYAHVMSNRPVAIPAFTEAMNSIGEVHLERGFGIRGLNFKTVGLLDELGWLKPEDRKKRAATISRYRWKRMKAVLAA